MRNTQNFDIPNRILKFNFITKFLATIDTHFQSWLYGNESEKPIFLNNGLFGSVSLVVLKTIPKISIVVKTFKQELKTTSTEAKFGFLINNILFDQQCPNFLFTYDMASCTHRLTNFETISIFMERATFSLSEYMYAMEFKTIEIVSEIMTSILYQLLIGLHILQWRFQIHHRDLHRQNILVLTVPHTEGYFKYIIDDEIYYVKNIGALVCIGDFGASESHPMYCNRNGYLGERDVEIIGNESIPLVDSKNVFKSMDWHSDKNGFQKGTQNDIFLDKVYDFGRIVDWTDSLKFPPRQFYFDIRDLFDLILTEFDVVEIFPPNFTRTCQILGSDEGYEIFKDLNQGSILLRADLALKHLYIPPKLDKIPVIREYCIR